jgi:predicted dehydrogenase
MNSQTSSHFTRRNFLKHTAAVGAGVAFSTGFAVRGAESPNNRIVVGVMGTSRNSIGGDGRGTELAVGLASLAGVEVGYICDVDERNVPKAIESVMKKGKQTRTPKGVRDFRRILEDKEVDALVIATPDHWHAPAAILGCAAGKHVYVEKPCCHNPHEGELLVAAARKHKRLVQHGTQRRSWPGQIEAAEKVRAGEIGRVLFAKAFYYGPRPSIGRGKRTPIPGWLDYELWQGPASERPFQDNVIHYNWHWFWHWGTGELGNNGVHYIDLCRMVLGLDLPKSVTSSGGKYRYPDDDQETPDTNVASFDFGSTTLTWEQRSWAPRTPADAEPEVVFYGDKGVLGIKGGGYTIHDLKGAVGGKGSGNGGNEVHLQNFIDAIRGQKKLNAEIEEGFKSALICHLGNIAWRTGRTIHFDAAQKKIVGDDDAMKFWRREYRPGWEPKV